MTGGFVLAIVAAVLFVAVALQAAARFLQRHPLDPRRNGSLFEMSGRTVWLVRPAELEQIEAVVAESLSSATVARSKLGPMLDELQRGAPAGRAAPTETASTRRARGRAIEARVAALEAAWGIDDER